MQSLTQRLKLRWPNVPESRSVFLARFSRMAYCSALQAIPFALSRSAPIAQQNSEWPLTSCWASLCHGCYRPNSRPSSTMRTATPLPHTLTR